jgi:hypothetical protein
LNRPFLNFPFTAFSTVEGMSDQNPIRTARRASQRKARLGNEAFCLFCGYACLESLTRVSRKWIEEKGISAKWIDRLLEDHHVVGEAHDSELTTTLCLNCHREITEGLAREGVSMHPERNPKKRAALVLKASATHFENLATSYRKLAIQLESESENK